MTHFFRGHPPGPPQRAPLGQHLSKTNVRKIRNPLVPPKRPPTTPRGSFGPPKRASTWRPRRTARLIRDSYETRTSLARDSYESCTSLGRPRAGSGEGTRNTGNKSVALCQSKCPLSRVKGSPGQGPPLAARHDPDPSVAAVGGPWLGSYRQRFCSGAALAAAASKKLHGSSWPPAS